MSQTMKERQEFLLKETLRPETKDEMLKYAAEQFAWYSENHRAKVAHNDAQENSTIMQSTMDKAKVNEELAAACRYALSLAK